MIKREFKARIVDDFRNKWRLAAATDENVYIDDTKFAYDSPELVSLGKRLSGNIVIVTLTENYYPEGENDF